MNPAHEREPVSIARAVDLILIIGPFDANQFFPINQLEIEFF
jgi:hypothetical protein